MTQTQEELLRAELMQFGKYRGKKLAVAIKDEQYCKWLAQQKWLRDWPYVFKVINEFYPDAFVEKEKRVVTLFDGLQNIK